MHGFASKISKFSWG